jgi:hypothetical protein
MVCMGKLGLLACSTWQYTIHSNEMKVEHERGLLMHHETRCCRDFICAIS